MVSAAQKKVAFQWQVNRAMLAFAALFLPLTVSLGFWQLQRADEKQALLSEYRAREAAAPVSVDEIEPGGEHQYRPATVSGHFINGRTLLLENRIRDGKPGYEVLTPLEYGPEKPLLWVNRGWVAGSYNRDELPDVPAVRGEVTLRGHLYRAVGKPFTAGEEVWRSQWPQVFQNFDPELLASRLERPLFPYTLRLDQDSTAALQTGWEIVNVMPEKHTGYAVQWFAMATALVILSLFANSNLGAVIKSRRLKPTSGS